MARPLTFCQHGMSQVQCEIPPLMLSKQRHNRPHYSDTTHAYRAIVIQGGPKTIRIGKLHETAPCELHKRHERELDVMTGAEPKHISMIIKKLNMHKPREAQPEECRGLEAGGCP